MAVEKFVILSLLVLSGVQAHTTQRMLVGDTVLENVEETDDSTKPVYQEVSATFGSVQVQNFSGTGWVVANIWATLELSTNASYAYNYNDGNGTSRFNATVQLVGNSSLSSSLSVHLHTAACGDANYASGMVTGPEGNMVPPLYLPTAGFNQTTSGRNVSNSTVMNFLVDYDEATSVAVHSSDDTVLGCVNFRPPFPDFPQDWSATIETTDPINGTTYLMQQIYSHTLNKIRLDVHSYGSDRIIISDPSQQTTSLIAPANGTCLTPHRQRSMNWITGADNVTLLSTAELLHASNSDQFKYVPGNFTVRGIQCELWQNDVNISNNWANATFTANFYFPINQWLVGREDYHRMLKQVYLNGTWGGQRFELYQEYVNFRPRQVYPAMFDVCAISPYGKNCNCTDALRRKAYQNLTQALSADDDTGVQTNDALKDACSLAYPIPHGFVKEQAGPYVGLTFIGLFAGCLFTALAMYLYYRKKVGVTITDNLGHTKFVDGEN